MFYITIEFLIMESSEQKKKYNVKFSWEGPCQKMCMSIYHNESQENIIPYPLPK